MTDDLANELRDRADKVDELNEVKVGLEDARIALENIKVSNSDPVRGEVEQAMMRLDSAIEMVDEELEGLE